MRSGVYHQVRKEGCGRTIDEVITASGQKNLEDAYLFFMGEEELL